MSVFIEIEVADSVATDPEFATKLGENGREHVRNNFLLTRHMRDYLLAFLYLESPHDSVVEL